MSIINYGDPEPCRNTQWRVRGGGGKYAWHGERGGWCWGGWTGISWRQIAPGLFPMEEVAA